MGDYEEPGSLVSAAAVLEELLTALRADQRIGPGSLFVGSALGSGQFGQVLEARVAGEGDGMRAAAVKRLLPGAREQDRIDFMREAYVMAQWCGRPVGLVVGVAPRPRMLTGRWRRDHPRIIGFIGFAPEDPAAIVLELADSALDDHLRKSPGTATTLERATWGLDLASAAEYLRWVSLLLVQPVADGLTAAPVHGATCIATWRVETPCWSRAKPSLQTLGSPPSAPEGGVVLESDGRRADDRARFRWAPTVATRFMPRPGGWSRYGGRAWRRSKRARTPPRV